MRSRSTRKSKTAAFVLFLSTLLTGEAWAYPEFIGYGYSSCLTCHYNGQGGGPLNDYGRALWSAEIASRAFFSPKISDEQLAEQSGFLGRVKLPFWLRPHLNYRGINLQQNPGGTDAAPMKYYHMQADFGATVSDEAGKYVASLTIGRVLKSEDPGNGHEGLERFLPREYFLRWQVDDNWWIYAGLMQKVFGLRNVNHASVQRKYQGFNPYNNTIQGIGHSQGIIAQRISEKWEVAGNYFFGNPYDEERYRQKGFSASGEYELAERKRIGASIASEKSEVLEKEMYAVHYRQGLGKGSSLMVELGLVKDTIVRTANVQSGSYGMIETMISLVRGYNLLTTIEHFNRTFQTSEPDQWRWGVGLWMFPLPRVEFRVDAQMDRQLSPDSSQIDTWQLIGQMHVSL